MCTQNTNERITETIDNLSNVAALDGLWLQHHDGDPLPSMPAIAEIVDLARAIIFPGYYGRSTINAYTLRYHTGVNVERLHELLTEQIVAGLCFDTSEATCTCKPTDKATRWECAQQLATQFVLALPELRRLLATDVEAAYNGDPAAESTGEIICCYPIIKAITNYRIAHQLLVEGVPLIPRIISEMAHSETGIDIHPAATIGHHFTIDHGTGVVIGATCIIGNNVKLYQGVTLGAKSFPLDEDGNPIKGIPRHPILEDDVIVYSNATVLGRITLGRGTIIGGNLWVTESTKPGERLVQAKRRKAKESIVRPEDLGGL